MMTRAIMCARLPLPNFAWTCAAVAASCTTKSCHRTGVPAMARSNLSAPPLWAALAAVNRATEQQGYFYPTSLNEAERSSI
eukprot:6189016-Pleurochrysis_carterae.AAC.1